MSDNIIGTGTNLPENGENLPDSKDTKPKPVYEADRFDGIFALIVFVLGYLFSRWVLAFWEGWGVFVFTTLYCVTVMWYFRKRGIQPTKHSMFWMGMTWLTGLSYVLWVGAEVEPWRNLFLFACAVYWIISATGTLLGGKTTDWLPADAINALFVIPFYNFFYQYRALAVFGTKKEGRWKRLGAVLLGLLLGLVALSVILPLLMKADGGGFNAFLDWVDRFLYSGFDWIAEYLLFCIPAIPVAAYLFGLVAGSVRKRGIGFLRQETLQRAGGTVRILAPATTYTMLGIVNALYVLFIALQLPYFFSAFTGKLPDGWTEYAEYARSGFFELCSIAVINLAVLTATNLLTRFREEKRSVIKSFTITLAVLTLLLIVTAFSKMALYIGTYGLSMPRLLPCVFMVFLAAVLTAVIVRQKKSFSIVRFGLIVGSVLLCVFCLSNPSGIVAQYNADRYLAGTLEEYDTTILYRAQAAGVATAIELYGKSEDGELKAELDAYLIDMRAALEYHRFRSSDNLQKAFARKALEEHFS